MKYIAIDTELGGWPEDCDLLTAFFGIYDDNFQLVEELDLALRPDSENDIIKLTAGGMAVNGIDIVKHFQIAETKTVCGKKLYDFLNKHSRQGNEKLIPVGQQVEGDIRRINKAILGKPTWDKYVSYRCLNAGNICLYLQACGRLPYMDAGLGAIMAHFQIDFQGNAHTARADAIASMECVKRLIEVGK